MTRKSDQKNDPPAPAADADAYLDLWERNLTLVATEGVRAVTLPAPK